MTSGSSRACSSVVARLLWALAIVVATLCAAHPAAAEDKIDRLAEKLRNSDDFRVRTQAALALGASKTKRAVEPLCGGLSDSKKTVRAASAAGLGKLKKGGVKCLEARLDNESSASVRAVIKKSLRRVKRALKKAIGPSTKIYVAFEVKNKTDLSDSTVLGRVRSGFKRGAKKLDGCLIAPNDEDLATAKKLLAKHDQVEAFFLSPKVRVKYSTGVMKVKMSVAVFTYPGKALKGMFSVTVGMADVKEDDESTMKTLVKEAAKAAFKKFGENLDGFR